MKRVAGKLITYMGLIVLTVSCATMVHKKMSGCQETVYYVDKNSFSEHQITLINRAVETFNEEFSCSCFRKVDYYKFKKVLLFINLFGSEKTSDGFPTIGKYVDEDNVVYLKSRRKNGRYIENTLFFKTVLHELAHVLGMRGHAFPVEENHSSQLTPVISKDSFPILYDRDASYIENNICREPYE